MAGQKTKLTFIADTHHFSLSLANDGRAYDLRSGSDQKCLKETGGIIDAAFSHISKSDTEAVLIIGDLTNDGETVCHNEFLSKLYALQKAKPVYVITATHDWCCDQNSRRYDGNNVYADVPTLSHEQLREFYYDFGSKQAISEYITHLGTSSYTVDIGENVRLLALNDDQNGKGRAGFTDEHFDWIEQQISMAKEDGKILLAMEHHLIMPNIHPLITGGGTCVGDRDEVAARLADAGLKYMFVGHSHLQGISEFTSANGNKIMQINVGSLCGYPSPIVNVTVTDDGLDIETDCVKQFQFEGKIYDVKKYLAEKAYDLVDRVIDTAKLGKTEFADRLTALQLDGDKYGKLYFAAKPLLRFVSKATVKDVYKLLKCFGLAKDVDFRTVALMENRTLIDIIHEVLLSALDGSAVRYSEESAYYKVVIGAADALVQISNNKLTNDIKQTLHNIMTGGEYNINDCHI